MSAKEKAQEGLKLIEAAILQLLEERKYGLTNNEISVELGLESDQAGKQKNYLAWSALGILMKAKKVSRLSHQRPGENTKREIYKLSQSNE
jgi:hypothetical protein